MPSSVYRPKAGSSTTPVANRQRKRVPLKVPQTENILFIGSEMHYDLFWLKMMFIGAGYVLAASQMRPATRQVLAYVDVGYSRLEKLTLDQLQAQHGFEIARITGKGDVTRLLNRERADYKLQDVIFTCHGVIGAITLNYDSSPRIDITASDFTAMPADAFAPQGRLQSYACRTGISVEDLKLGFSSEADAHPENSMAQTIANHFDIEVRAFRRRSNYAGVLRDAAQSAAIARALRAGRDSAGSAAVVQIPPEHEALPHPGLADRGSAWLGTGPRGEGTDNYALWRKQGGRALPVAGDSPSGVSGGMHTYSKPHSSDE